MRWFQWSGDSHLALMVGALISLGSIASANAQNRGFQINRYEPTAAGEWSFLVDHPWYSRTRRFAAGVSLNYAHSPLVRGQFYADGSLTQPQAVIAHQLTGHIDVAGSFLDRVLLTASLPVAFLERGEPSQTSGVAPAGGAYISDPRIGAMVRIFGQPYTSALSLSAGGTLWIPLRAFSQSLPEQGSDQQVRGLLKAVLGGLSRQVLWSATAGVLVRQETQLGSTFDKTGSTAGHELQFGAAVAYADTERRFAVGPELALGTALSANIFRQYSTSLEILAGGHYNVARLVNVGLAGGFGILRQSGTPDGRFLLRIAYAPLPRTAPQDRDHDGVADARDRCPDEPQGAQPDSELPGCPQRDRDGDGLSDRQDRCPEQAPGARIDPARPGCPAGDRDSDGIYDPEDLCPDQSDKPVADPGRAGCPAGDKDGDGVYDPADRCPDQPAGARPSPAHPGCPAVDQDGDGVDDLEDLCADVPAGTFPDPERKGCPAADRDKDLVPDRTDACPDQAGMPNPDAQKSGCPAHYVIIRSDSLFMSEQIVFGYNRNTVAPQSSALLQEVVLALNKAPQLRKVRVEGHTDNTGMPGYLVALSRRRAASVRRWLIEHGVAAERLVSEGYGDTRPIASNNTPDGRSKNRRIDFVIIEPAAPASDVHDQPASGTGSTAPSNTSVKPNTTRKPQRSQLPKKPRSL